MKTKHEKIVEILKHHVLTVTRSAKYDEIATLIEQLEPEGEDLTEEELATIIRLCMGGSVHKNWDALSIKAAKWLQSHTPPQQPSEGEIVKISESLLNTEPPRKSSSELNKKQ